MSGNSKEICRNCDFLRKIEFNLPIWMENDILHILNSFWTPFIKRFFSQNLIVVNEIDRYLTLGFIKKIFYRKIELLLLFFSEKSVFQTHTWYNLWTKLWLRTFGGLLLLKTFFQVNFCTQNISILIL